MKNVQATWEAFSLGILGFCLSGSGATDQCGSGSKTLLNKAPKILAKPLLTSKVQFWKEISLKETLVAKISNLPSTLRQDSYLKVPPFEEGSAAADAQEASTAALASPSLPPAAVLQPGAPVAGPYFPNRIREYSRKRKVAKRSFA